MRKKSSLILLVFLMNGCVGTIKLAKQSKPDLRHTITPSTSKNSSSEVVK
ncbi:MAG: Unknown protein [uncultured Sulfurovum sp.]|uniref:Uncharacterized protein n=1 Tax=uncultured Sulfurovum sp. TaxID=269237 RepID=A0A6S6TTS8_9BACT|nr:MAG: Unknown protein [uncultured Sulfurovum sp.]